METLNEKEILQSNLKMIIWGREFELDSLKKDLDFLKQMEKGSQKNNLNLIISRKNFEIERLKPQLRVLQQIKKKLKKPKVKK